MKDIEAVVEEMPDEQAQVESLIENFQRSDLSDLEKAEGIAGLATTFEKAGKKHPISAAAKAVGINPSYAHTLLDVHNLKPETKAVLNEARRNSDSSVTARTALVAERIGGVNAVRRAVQDQWGREQAIAMEKEIDTITTPRVRAQIIHKVIEGKLRSAPEIRAEAQEMEIGRLLKTTHTGLIVRFQGLINELTHLANQLGEIYQERAKIPDSLWQQGAEKLAAKVKRLRERRSGKFTVTSSIWSVGANALASATSEAFTQLGSTPTCSPSLSG